MALGDRTVETMELSFQLRLSVRSKKGRLSEVNVKLLARMTSTVKVEDLVRETANRDESARGVTPNPSPRTEPTSSCWLG